MPAAAIRSPASRCDEKRNLLKSTSYRDYLIKICGCSEEAANCFQGRPLGFFGLGCDAVRGGRRARSRLSGLRRPEAAGRHQSGLERALHLSFPRRQCVARAAAGARAHSRTPRRATRWTTSCRRRSTTRALDRDGAPVRIRLDSTCVHAGRTSATPPISPMCAAAAAPRRGEARGARLLPHDDSLHHAGTAAAAARRRWRRTSRRRWSTPMCWCATGRPWCSSRSFDLRADVVPQSGGARLSGQPRRLSASARSGRADAACTWSHVPGAPNRARRARAFRIGRGKLYA